MIPMLMKIKIPQENSRSINIYIPIFLAWLLLAVLLLIMTPFVLLAALFTWRQGLGGLILMVIPTLCEILWHMQGLLIDVEGPDETIYVSFI